MVKKSVQVYVMLPQRVFLDVEYDRVADTFEILDARQVGSPAASSSEIEERVLNDNDKYSEILDKLEKL